MPDNHDNTIALNPSLRRPHWAQELGSQAIGLFSIKYSKLHSVILTHHKVKAISQAKYSQCTANDLASPAIFTHVFDVNTGHVQVPICTSHPWTDLPQV